MQKTNDLSEISFNNSIQFNYYNSINRQYAGSELDRPIALILSLILLPLFILNVLLTIITCRSLLSRKQRTDALNRTVIIHNFSCGVFPDTAVLFDILLGKLAFCGIPITHSMSPCKQFKIANQIRCKAGIFSLYDLHKKTGLTVMNAEELLIQQLNGLRVDYLTLFFKSIFLEIFYSSSKSEKIKLKKLNNSYLDKSPINSSAAGNCIIPLFGLPINNSSMTEAVNWVIHHKNHISTTELAFFVNVNSINLSISQPSFFINLSKANKLFADGSGMRLASKKAGFILRDNNNGTDMLPHLCRSCINNNKSLYFLGSKPGIAAKAASNLQDQFPGLNIAGTEHGYNLFENTNKIITAINASQCDILLVALGSPLQEQWLLKNKEQLHCNKALAVGGLFDFYSGNISRSPMWFRELGMEWVWRLIQEPKNKFIRYVVGNPLFLYRTFFLNLVNTGVKK